MDYLLHRLMILVKKLNGETEEFQEEKLVRSLTRAGASKGTIKDIKKKIKTILYNGITTKKIFSIAFREFKKNEHVYANKYDLKNALQRLGKSGFPFEEFITRIMTFKEYSCTKNKIIKGDIITHEIDVLANKDSEKLMIECKHHMKPWDGIHIQTALYVYARFLDVKKHFTTPMISSNTWFTPQVKKYAKGVNMRLFGWKHPVDDSLEKNIEHFKAFPITMLRSIPDHLIPRLTKKNKVLLSDLCEYTPKKFAQVYTISEQKATVIVEESGTLCGIESKK